MTAGKKNPEPGAATAAVDDESGAEGLDDADERQRSIKALTIMRDRGLIPAEDYERRVAALTEKSGA